MKQLTLIVISLLAIMTSASAQYEITPHWTPTHSNNEGAAANTVVLAKLNLGDVEQSATGTGPNWALYEVAAFIGSEVRACQLGYEAYHPQTQDANFFMLNVRGNFNSAGDADNGKTITFKLYNHATGIEYNLTTSTTCKFNGESTYGSPGQPFVLSAVEVTDFFMVDITMKEGQTLTLTDFISWEPGDATIPNNLEWNLGNFTSQFTLNGNKLTAKANSEGTYELRAMLGQNTDYGGLRMMKRFRVTVNSAVESVEGFFVNLGAPLVQGVAKTMKLTPTNVAEVDLSQLTVTEGTGDQSYPWKLLNIGQPTKNSDGSVSVAITPLYPGEAVIEIHYGSLDIDPQRVEIGVPLTLKKGWQWVTLWATGQGSASDIFGTNVDEVRSQSELLGYDANVGFYGDLIPCAGMGYKLKANKDVTAANAYVQTGGYVNMYGAEEELKKAWTWIGYPYVHAFAPNKLQLTATAGDRIVSKDDGFVEYKNGSWTGTLTQLKPYQSYLYYNNSGATSMLTWESEDNIYTAATRGDGPSHLRPTVPTAYLHRNQWDYDASPFRDNMSIVAVVNGLTSPEQYSIGAFVGDECRGEGVYIDGRFFITVHAHSGETVSFRLSDDHHNLMFDIDQTVPMSIVMGSLDAPVRLSSPAFNSVEGIDELHISDFRVDSQCYDLKGCKVANGHLSKGIYVIGGKKVVK